MVHYTQFSRSVQNAWYGLSVLWREEQNFRIELVSSLLVLLCAALFQCTIEQWGFLILAIGMVLIAEAVNTIVEHITDILKPRISPHAKHIKDIAAGMVLFSGIIAVFIGCIVFLPHIASWIIFVFSW